MITINTAGVIALMIVSYFGLDAIVKKVTGKSDDQDNK